MQDTNTAAASAKRKATSAVAGFSAPSRFQDRLQGFPVSPPVVVARRKEAAVARAASSMLAPVAPPAATPARVGAEMPAAPSAAVVAGTSAAVVPNPAIVGAAAGGMQLAAGLPALDFGTTSVNSVDYFAKDAIRRAHRDTATARAELQQVREQLQLVEAERVRYKAEREHLRRKLDDTTSKLVALENLVAKQEQEKEQAEGRASAALQEACHDRDYWSNKAIEADNEQRINDDIAKLDGSHYSITET